MKTENLKKPLAFLMAVLMSVSCFGQSMGVAAADTGTEPDEGTDSYEEYAYVLIMMSRDGRHPLPWQRSIFIETIRSGLPDLRMDIRIITSGLYM